MLVYQLHFSVAIGLVLRLYILARNGSGGVQVVVTVTTEDCVGFVAIDIIDGIGLLVLWDWVMALILVQLITVVSPKHSNTS